MDTTPDVTGNHYVFLDGVRRDGTIHAINAVWPARGGLVEWHGPEDDPLLAIELRAGSEPVDTGTATWRRLDRWVPEFTVRHGGSTFVVTLLAPSGGAPARGFIVHLEVENRGTAELDVELGLRVRWAGTRLRVAAPRPLGGAGEVLADPRGLVLVGDDRRGPALAFAGDHATLHPPGAGSPGVHEAFVAATLSVPPGRRRSAALHAGAGREEDAARAAAAALQRVPAEQWLRETRLELSHLLQPGGNPRWSELINRNLLFNRFGAAGRGLDDDRLYLMRSRASECPRGALFNEREGLFWTLPALLVADPPLAREALMRMLEMFSERSGEHERTLDGGVFDPGLNTEQVLLYAWAAGHYVDTTGDVSLLDEPLLQHVLRETDFTLFVRLHPEQMLVSTELLPMGEPADEPWATLPNVLLATFARRLDALLTGFREEPPQFRETAAEISAAVWQHCVTDVHGETVLASSTDLQGRATVYDDPAFSLVLLPFLGFCDADDPVWRTTVAFLRSPAYTLWRNGEVPGLAGRSDPQHPRLSALLAELLGPDRTEALDRLARVRLPGGLAAAAWDPGTGEAREPCNAALAGFLAWTTHLATRTDTPPRNRAARRGRRP